MAIMEGYEMKQEKLRHAVMFRFAPHTTEADRQRVTGDFAALKEQVPGILSFEWGKNISPEGLVEAVFVTDWWAQES